MGDYINLAVGLFALLAMINFTLKARKGLLNEGEQILICFVLTVEIIFMIISKISIILGS